MRDSGLSTIADLSQAMVSRAVWGDICNIAGVDVDASTVSRRGAKKKEAPPAVHLVQHLTSGTTILVIFLHICT